MRVLDLAVVFCFLPRHPGKTETSAALNFQELGIVQKTAGNLVTCGA